MRRRYRIQYKIYNIREETGIFRGGEYIQEGKVRRAG